MAVSLNLYNCSVNSPIANPNFNSLKFPINPNNEFFFSTSIFKKKHRLRRRPSSIFNEFENDSDQSNLHGAIGTKYPKFNSGMCFQSEEEVNNPGVKVALSMLRFYKREISPLLPNSCRYVPTCSEYSMIAYKKYGVVKGTVLTVWRLCRCNPLGGSGFDPPRWFDETSTPDQ
ncbi:uncharacterized protein LOC114264644 isoform X1 [Camellia sinensis]|uniref:uncharacterized protein LOC114264644 isoform X1 n=1 Tax=Camellia sinensis TaxID=4442 RepID=UPI001036E90B|nr:uncharacterized protein LOC114264644 isoform X1 [Camellia sinensis]XP_028061125.1 uncharacterized protein LOC114264644 isoform X1 [Camellia sinensis]XP_028061126.1 uncharacterized protein LOC114264644 isoform X1 [Camellia sinensis]